MADSDGDGASDWYEVAGTFSDPTNTGDAPIIPHPLPTHNNGDPIDGTKPVKVYILSGQSNMVGFGRVGGTGPGTLQTIVKSEGKFTNMVDGSGNWIARDDVMYRGVITALGNGPMAPGFGAGGGDFGPELGFGQVMGYYYDEPVIVLKSSQGNRSISWDFAPPSTPRFDYNGLTYGGYGDSPGTWPAGTEKPPAEPGAWYAGKQWDDCFMDEADWAPLGIDPVFNVTDILDNFATEYPQYAGQGFEIAGYVWWQGHKDQGEPHASRYELNMVNFINDMRLYYENRYPANTIPNAPFVLATIAFGGWDLAGAGLTVANGQLAVSGETGNYPEFAGNVKTMEARGYWRDSNISPTNTGYHYNHNAETYMLVGDALGRAMMELESGSTVYSVDAGPDMISWSGEPVELDATVQDGVTVVSYAWSAEPNGIGDPDIDVVFDSNSIEDPTVTIAKAAGDAVTVTLTLTVNDGENPPVEDSMTIDVYDDACKATIGKGLAVDNPADFDENCITGFEDLAVMASTWLDSEVLQAPIPK